ncbi:hypothetical protein SESBI_02404 [Sesbania bispinosa]|nr:hypothetical protein SESBI_02404 [Sesbania bispinosa]
MAVASLVMRNTMTTRQRHQIGIDAIETSQDAIGVLLHETRPVGTQHSRGASAASGTPDAA